MEARVMNMTGTASALIAVLGTIALLALAWMQPQQAGPFGAWQVRVVPTHCLIWTAPGVSPMGTLYLDDCDNGL